MDRPSRTEQDRPPTVRDPQLWALVLLLVVLFAGAFVYAYQRHGMPGGVLVTTQLQSGGQSSSSSPQSGADSDPIAVHVAGAVKKPGVYYLRRGSRVVDALSAAGGMAAGADEGAVNPAARLEDGDQVIVPTKGETTGTGPAVPSASSVVRHADTAERERTSGRRGSAKLHDPREGTVNINTASSEELQRLPGVGPAIAARILAYRSQVGRFTTVDQLMEVSGIGEKKLAAMRPFVRLK